MLLNSHCNTKFQEAILKSWIEGGIHALIPKIVISSYLILWATRSAKKEHKSTATLPVPWIWNWKRGKLHLHFKHWCHKLTPNEPDLILLLKQGPAAQDKDSSVGSMKAAVISGSPPGSTINFPDLQFCLHRSCLQSVIFLDKLWF